MGDALAILAPLSLAHFAAAVSPGPSFVLIARTAAGVSRAAAIRMSLGLGLGAMLWAGAALFGLTLLFQIAPWTYQVLRFAGAAFLVYLGVQLWRHARQPMPEGPAAGPARGSDVLHGFLVQIANPKVSIFFGSVFVALVPPDTGASLLAVLLALILVVETAWYVVVSAVFAAPRVRARYARAKAAIDRVCGGVIGLLGLRLAAA